MAVRAPHLIFWPLSSRWLVVVRVAAYIQKRTVSHVERQCAVSEEIAHQASYVLAKSLGVGA